MSIALRHQLRPQTFVGMNDDAQHQITKQEHNPAYTLPRLHSHTLAYAHSGKLGGSEKTPQRKDRFHGSIEDDVRQHGEASEATPKCPPSHSCALPATGSPRMPVGTSSFPGDLPSILLNAHSDLLGALPRSTKRSYGPPGGRRQRASSGNDKRVARSGMPE